MLRALYVRLSDWWRPIYYNRILKRPNVSLVIPKVTLGTKARVDQ